MIIFYQRKKKLLEIFYKSLKINSLCLLDNVIAKPISIQTESNIVNLPA